MALDLPKVDVVEQTQDAPGALAAIRQALPDVRAKEKTMTDKDEEKVAVEEEEKKDKKSKGGKKKDKKDKKKGKKKDKKKQ